VVEGRVGKKVDGEPRRVTRQRRIDVRRHQSDVRRGDNPPARVTVRVAARLELLVLPVPFLRSTGLGRMLIPLVSVAVVLTRLPAILASVGPRWDWPRLRNETSASRGWTAWARDWLDDPGGGFSSQLACW
jgi:hypothetical protein